MNLLTLLLHLLSGFIFQLTSDRVSQPLLTLLRQRKMRVA